MPDEPEAVGLLALMLLTEARRPARTAADGSMVRLADQDRALWDSSLIAEGHALVRACLRRNQPGPFQIQAAIAAVHADAPTADATDWSQIVALYDQLFAVRPNPVVALNRAIAIGELHGPEVGLEAVESLDAAALEDYQPYHAARADLLARTGDHDDGARRLRPRHRAHDQPHRAAVPAVAADGDGQPDLGRSSLHVDGGHLRRGERPSDAGQGRVGGLLEAAEDGDLTRSVELDRPHHRGVLEVQDGRVVLDLDGKRHALSGAGEEADDSRVLSRHATSRCR